MRKLILNIEKGRILHTGSKSIQAEYRLSNREIKKVNEKCSLGVDFDMFTSGNCIGAPVLRHGIWSVILRLESIQRRVTKIKIIKEKD